MFNKMSINNNNNERLQREIANRREYVQNSWKTAISKNKTRYDEGDSMATEEYCYQNQIYMSLRILQFHHKLVFFHNM